MVIINLVLFFCDFFLCFVIIRVVFMIKYVIFCIKIIFFFVVILSRFEIIIMNFKWFVGWNCKVLDGIIIKYGDIYLIVDMMCYCLYFGIYVECVYKL